MQEIIEIDLWNLITLIISCMALLVSTVVYLDSRSKEKTRKKELRIQVLAECQTILEDTIRMHPEGALKAEVTFMLTLTQVEEIQEHADQLKRLSWRSGKCGEIIRDAALVLESLIRNPYVGRMPNNECKALIGNLTTTRNTIVEYLENIRQ